MKIPSNSKNKNERGIALFMAIFALMLLSAIAAGFMYLANTETAVNANYRSGQQAYFAARAGLQEARLRIATGGVGDLSAQAYALTMPNAANKLGGIYITNPAIVDGTLEAAAAPWDPADKYFDDTLCKANFQGLGLAYGSQSIRCSTVPANGQAPAAQWAVAVPSTSATTGMASALGYKWVRITLKGNKSGSPYTGTAYPYAVDSTAAANDNRQVCWNGLQEVLLPAGYTNCSTPPSGSDPLKPVFLLTTMAKMASGSERTLSMEVADDPPTYTKAAVFTNDNVVAKGTSASINGYDNCLCACSGSTCTDRATGAACSGNSTAISTSGSETNNGNPLLTAPVIPAVQTGINPFPFNIPAMITKYQTAPGTVDVTGPPYNLTCSGSPADCGTVTKGTFGTEPNPWPPTNPANPAGVVTQVTYVPGNLDLQAHSTGAGVLVVDGDLVIHGGLEFYGLILVKGTVTFTGGGSGGGSNILGSILSGTGASADVLGGSVNIQYDTCALNRTVVTAPPRVLGSREIEY